MSTIIPHLTFCTPTLICYDLCVKLLQSVECGIVVPSSYVVIDNGGGLAQHLLAHDIQLPRLRIIPSDSNLGVAGSWNWFLNNLSGLLLISNDDLEVYPDTLQKFLQAQQSNMDPNTLTFTIRRAPMSFFLVDTSIKDKVGLFDEKFYPAYFEDNDYEYRFKLGGYSSHIVECEQPFHVMSATLKEQHAHGKNRQHNINFDKNRQYYISKWGGLPRHETFKTPFNK